MGKRRRRGRRPGRPPLAAETRSLILRMAPRSLILRMARENPRWGYMRIRGELLKLGINVSATTVATALRVSGLGPAPRRIGPSWSQFLRPQAQSMLGTGLPSEPAGGLEGNESAPNAPTPEACGCRGLDSPANRRIRPQGSAPFMDLRSRRSGVGAPGTWI
jgi:hypothetical protein